MENKLKQCGKAIRELLSKKDIDKALTTVKAKNLFQHKLFLKETGLTEKAPDQLHLVFDVLDLECRVFHNELQDFMKAFDPNARELTPDEVAAMMKDGDLHNEGKIGLDGFMHMVALAKQQA